jgi:hypothetical protein
MAKNERSLNAEALKDLVESGSAPFKTNSRSYVLTCPMCDRDKLYVERSTGRGKCFRCEWTGWADFLLSKVYGRSIDELGELLYGAPLKGTGPAPEERYYRDFWGETETEDDFLPDPIDYPPEMLPDPEWVGIESEAGAKGAEYLERRGVPRGLAALYGVVYHRAEQRVIFPAYVDGILRGWQGRYVGETEGFNPETGRVFHVPKAKTTGKIGGRLLMWQDRVNPKHLDWAVLVEGPLDCIKCHLVGNNVCSLGKDVSQQQVDILLRLGIKKLYIGLDRDAGKDVERIARKLADHLKLYRLLPPDNRDDLGDCTFDEVYRQFFAAEEYFPGMLQRHLKGPR